MVSVKLDASWTKYFVSGMRTRSAYRLRPMIILAVIMAVTVSCAAQPKKEPDYDLARQRMIRTQLAARDISDKRVLQAFDRVERHLFVDDSLRRYAYTDQPLPIDENQTISQPYIVSLMTQLLEIQDNDRVLEIGTGSGYQAAILAELAASVFTIEILDSLGRKAERLLGDLGYENVTVRIGDGYLGWPEEAPFDAIIVTCAAPRIPDPLIDQLAEGGRLVIPVGSDWQELILLRKKDGQISREEIAPVRFVPMTGQNTREQ